MAVAEHILLTFYWSRERSRARWRFEEVLRHTHGVYQDRFHSQILWPAECAIVMAERYRYPCSLQHCYGHTCAIQAEFDANVKDELPIIIRVIHTIEYLGVSDI